MIKINMLLLNVLYLILQVASGSQHEIIETLMPNVLVLKVDLDVFFETNVPLSCGEAHQDTDVTWRKNGSPVGSGNQITVKVEEMLAGNYSCHNQNGDYLNHTLVLVQDNQSHNRKRRILKEYNENDKNEYIRCLARNYSGMFHCSWKKSLHRNSASVVLVQAARFSGSNVSCYVDANSAGLTCEDTESCPYSEEVSHINLTVYFRTNFLLEEYTTTPFLIREIVRPDTVDFIKVKEEMFHWNPPVTWSTPCSYFPLLFQVKAVDIGENCDSDKEAVMEADTTKDTKYSVLRNEYEYRFCIRAKDELVESPWSQWAYYEVNEEY